MFSHIIVFTLKCFLAPIVSHLIGLRFWGRSMMTYNDQGGFLFQFYLTWQALMAAIYLGIFYLQHRFNTFLISVMIRSVGLGLGFSFGAQMVLQSFQETDKFGYLLPLGLYLITLSVFHTEKGKALISCGLFRSAHSALLCFHITEFLAIALVNPHSVSVRDFVLGYNNLTEDHPKSFFLARAFNAVCERAWPGFQYHLLLTGTVLEYLIELYWFGPDLKLNAFPWMPYLGFGLCLAGELIRKVAMIIAGKNFNHTVQEQHNPDHVLVNQGIYSVSRHPSYVGLFAWVIGSQIILMNPICLNAVTVLTWLVLRERILREETKLVKFFGPKYLEYRRQVRSGIPFIN